MDLERKRAKKNEEERKRANESEREREKDDGLAKTIFICQL